MTVATRTRLVSVATVLVLYLASGHFATAQQDVVVDPAHHKLEFENNCVRVVRADFGPHERAAAMFDAQDVVIVSLTGSQGMKLKFADGKTVETPSNYPGQVFWAPGGRFQPENIGDTRIEFIVIEPKGCK